MVCLSLLWEWKSGIFLIFQILSFLCKNLTSVTSHLLNVGSLFLFLCLWCRFSSFLQWIFLLRCCTGRTKKKSDFNCGTSQVQNISLYTDKWTEDKEWMWTLCVLPPGQERFISMTRIYYKGALGCVVMFDVTSSASFLSCRRWKQDLDNKAMLPNGDSIPCILLANKVTQCVYCN